MSEQAPPAPTMSGVLETVLYVDDLAPARAFYGDVLGLPVIFEDKRMLAFDVAQQSALLVFERGASLEPIEIPGRGTIPPHDGVGPAHMAFQVPADALEAWEGHLARHGIGIEGRVSWPRGGSSVYFRDPAGNLLELATPGLWPGF